MDKDQKQIIDHLKARHHLRVLNVRAEEVNKETRTMELSFSSEEPVERWWGFEILDHSEKSANLDRLNNKAALLWNHDRDRQIGVVEKAWLDGKMGRATIRFSKNAEAEEHFKDVQDGIKGKISFAYDIGDMVLEKEVDKTAYYRVKEWMPYEISLVSIPADDTVGIGRDFGEDENLLGKIRELIQKANNTPATQSASAGTDSHKNKQEDLRMEDPKTLTPEQIEAAEKQRVTEIEAIGKEYASRIEGGKERMDELVKAAITLKRPVEELRGAVFVEVRDNKPLEDTGHFLGMEEKEKERYSISRAILSIVPGSKEKAEFERKCSDEIAKRTGKPAQGIYVPHDVRAPRRLNERQMEEMRRLARAYGMRDLSAGVDTQIVGTDLMAGSYIDILRNRAYVLRLGAFVLSGLKSNVAIPKMASSTTGYWVSTEGNAPTESEPTWGQVALDPKTLGTFTDITRQLLIQSTPSVDALVTDDIIRVLANTIDAGMLHGTDASGQPEGLVTVSGPGSVDGTTMAWEGAVEFETDVAAANGDVPSMAFLTTAAVRGTLKTREKATGLGYICGGVTGDNMINGYPVFVSGNVSANHIFFGDWSQAILGEFGSLDLTYDPYTASSSGTVRIVALQSIDVGFRQAAAFSVCTNFS